MKLLAHIEEYKKDAFKETKHENQGANSIVTRLDKTKGIPETKFKKAILLEDQLYDLISEVQARTVIEHVNKAFRAYGYKTNLLDIPLEFDWYIEYNKRYGWQINLISSAFRYGKTAVMQPVRTDDKPDRGDRIYDIIASKANYLLALIGNGDFNSGNLVLHDKAHKNYAIDFAMAFSFNFKDVSTGVRESQSKRYRWEKYLVFWQSYIQHNKNNVVGLMKQDGIATINKLKAELYNNDFKKEEIDEYVERAKQASAANIKKLLENFSALKNEIDSKIKEVRKNGL